MEVEYDSDEEQDVGAELNTWLSQLGTAATKVQIVCRKLNCNYELKFKQSVNFYHFTPKNPGMCRGPEGTC